VLAPQAGLLACLRSAAIHVTKNLCVKLVPWGIALHFNVAKTRHKSSGFEAKQKTPPTFSRDCSAEASHPQQPAWRAIYPALAFFPAHFLSVGHDSPGTWHGNCCAPVGCARYGWCTELKNDALSKEPGEYLEYTAIV
jgi:hypothetical protein